MAEKKKDNPGNGNPKPIDPALCAAYREVLKNEITGLKDDMKKIDNRTWQILAGVGVSILLMLLSIAMNY